MKDIPFDEVFDQPVESVWAALTSAEAMTGWLMENDFEPRLGHRFLLYDARARNRCEVLELDPPRRMAWAWRGNDGAAPLTRVVFELAPDGARTHLTGGHLDMADEWVEGVTSGWRKIFGRLQARLADG